MIYDQSTIPTIPRIHDTRPTFQQFRERYGLSCYEVAVQAGIRVLFVYCMERRGSTIDFLDALRLMNVLSKYAGYPVPIEEMQGIRLKNNALQAFVFQRWLHKEQ